MGFIEGEGSYIITKNKVKNILIPSFSLCQHKKSKKVIDLISKFILNLNYNIPFDIKVSSDELNLVKQ